MSITSGVSFLAQTQSQTRRLVDMRVTLDDLQRQIATGKKHDNLSGFGLDTNRLLQMRADRAQIEAYSFNIGSAVTRINLMDRSLTEIQASMKQMADGLLLRPVGAANDVKTINAQATQLLDFVADLTNISIDGRHLFSGSDTQTPPFADKNVVNNNFQAQVTGWLDGSITTAQLIAGVDAFISTDLGFSSTLGGAQEVNVRISKSTELTYGVLADQSGIEKVVRAMAFLSHIKQPDPAVDIPPNAEYEQVMSYIMKLAQDATQDIRNSQVKISSTLQLVRSIQDAHDQDAHLFSSVIDSMENTDMTEAVTRLQAMQTQMTASYEVTRIMSELSLVNFLR